MMLQLEFIILYRGTKLNIMRAVSLFSALPYPAPSIIFTTLINGFNLLSLGYAGIGREEERLLKSF